MHNKIDELEYIEVSNTKSSIKIALQGAHILDFKVKGKKPLLFLSESAQFKKGVPIRGGVPICWPWFGAHPSNNSLPNHGFARTSLWEHFETVELSPSKTKIILGLDSSDESMKLWPYEFELRLEIEMSETLELSLISKNTGDKTFDLSQALHTYLQIEDIHQARLQGVDTKPFYNKLNNSFNNLQTGDLHFQEEIDRVYHHLDTDLLLEDIHQDIHLKTIGSDTVVVWNPGKDFKQSFSDLSDYKTMLCLESANTLESEIKLEPSQSHTLKSILSQKER